MFRYAAAFKLTIYSMTSFTSSLCPGLSNDTAWEEWRQSGAGLNFPAYELFQPNSDVAGLGVRTSATSWLMVFNLSRCKVLLGFLASAYLTLPLVCWLYLRTLSTTTNRNDQAFITFWCRRSQPPAQANVLAAERCVLMISDQQLVTGLAILGAGFTQLTNDLPAIYWQVIVNLAWFSTITHLATLAALRTYFKAHSTIRNWRLVLMIALALLQIAALVPTGHPFWPLNYPNTPYNIPAKCYFTRTSQRNPDDAFDTLGMTISVIFIVISLSAKAIAITDRASRTRNTIFRSKANSLFVSWLRKLGQRSPHGYIQVLKRPLLVVVASTFVLYQAALDVFSSVLWEVHHSPALSSLLDPAKVGQIMWLAIAIAWGTVRLVKTRNLVSAEEIWGFGQWIPVLLVGLPLLSIFEAAQGKPCRRRVSAKPEVANVRR